MTQLSANTSDHHSANAALLKAGQDLVDLKSLLTSNLEPLRGSWRGAAAQQFDEDMRQWQAGLDQIAASVEKLARLVGSAGTAYEQIEQDVLRATQGR